MNFYTSGGGLSYPTETFTGVENTNSKLSIAYHVLRVLEINIYWILTPDLSRATFIMSCISVLISQPKRHAITTDYSCETHSTPISVHISAKATVLNRGLKIAYCLAQVLV